MDSSPAESHVSIHPGVSPRLIVIFGSLGPSFCLSGVEPSKHELGAHVPFEYLHSSLSLSLVGLYISYHVKMKYMRTNLVSSGIKYDNHLII